MSLLNLRQQHEPDTVGEVSA